MECFLEEAEVGERQRNNHTTLYKNRQSSYIESLWGFGVSSCFTVLRCS